MTSIARPIATTRFALALFRTSFASAMGQRGTFLLQVCLMALNNAIFFTFWLALFQHVATIRGYALTDVLVLYGVVAAAVGLAVVVAGGSRVLAVYINDGELDALLAQPKPTLLYAIGRRTLASGLGDIVSGIAMIALSGVVRPTTIPLALFAIVAGAAVCVATGVLFNSAAFWLGRVDTAARQGLDWLVLFSLYPDSLFGGPLRLMLFTVIPAGFLGYLPAQLIREPSVPVAGELFLGVTAYCLAAWWTFSRGLRRYSAGSRFGVNG